MEDKILKRISRRVTLDEDYVKECGQFDNMVNMVYNPPEGLSSMEDAVFFVDPGAHDAEKVASNIFDTYNPKWDILPRGPDDKENAEKLERWLEWQMAQANMHGETEPFRQMMVHSLRYGRVCAQLDYLPYWLPKDKSKWTKSQKAEMLGGPYCIVLHHPTSVKYEMGKYGLRWAATVANIPAGDVLDHWESYSGKSDEGKKIAAAVKKVEKLLDDDEEARVILVDYTDIDKRYVACWLTTVETVEFEVLEGDVDVIEIVNGENKLGFINWVISVGSSDPLLTTLHRGSLWKNTNDAESIKRTSAYRLAFQPVFTEEGTGADVEADFSGTTASLKVPAGKKVTWNIPRQLDPAFNELSAQDRALQSSTTGLQSLQSMGNGSNIQFATINAIIQISITQLESYKRTVEKLLKGLGVLAFLWLKVDGSTEIGYRKSTKNQSASAGEQIAIGPDDFSEDALFIEAKLIPNTPTDKQQLVNMAMQLKQAGFAIPDEEHLERLGYGNPEALEERFYEQESARLAFRMFTKEMDAKLEMMVQQKLAEAQGQANAAQGQPVIPGGQGFNAAQGGASTAQAAPQMTRTAMEGADVTGRGV